MLAFGVSAMQGSGGGGREWLSNWFFQAGEWRWWALMPFVVQFEQGSGGGEYSPSVLCFEQGRDIAGEWRWAVCCLIQAGEWWWKRYSPSVSRFERGRDVCVAGGRIDVRCDEEGFTPPLTTSKMAFDVTRRGETLLVTSMCLQRLETSQ